VNALRTKIENEIRERGPIPFGRYMELCLYDSELGYYSRRADQFGRAGDFYTSSDVHAVFGRILARQFDEMWRTLGSPATIILRELGPGRGLFAQDVLDWSEKKFPEFFGALLYQLVEQSTALRVRIEQTLASRVAEGKAVVVGAQSPSLAAGRAARDEAPETIVFANEFFDALPVQILSATGSLRIGLREGRLIET